jgi:hypothetical protein
MTQAGNLKSTCKIGEVCFFTSKTHYYKVFILNCDEGHFINNLMLFLRKNKKTRERFFATMVVSSELCLN